MSLLSNSTYENPTTPFFALASQSANKWYTFPSLNGQVILQDASGSQILQSIGGDLFYNQELLARASDLQDISEWSDFPVLNPAGVNFDGNPLVNASTITASGDISGGGKITVAGDISGGGKITIAGDISGGGALSVSGVLSGSGVTVSGALQGGSLSVTGVASVGSVSSSGAVSGTTITGSGAVQGASLTTTGGLDMTNSAISRASSINLSNAGFAPYGQLTSPNGTQLLWNGAAVATGAAGDTSQWANFPMIAPLQGNGQPISNVTTVAATGNITTTADVSCNNVQATGNVNAFAFNGTNVEATNIAAGPLGSGKFCIMTNNSITSSTTDGLTISVPSNNLATTVASGTITNTATGIINNVDNNFEITADGGLNPLITPNIDLTAKNGNGGQINIKSQPGSVLALGGVVNITAEGGTVTIPQPPPELPISVTVGGELNLTATTGSGAGLYTATSAINLNAAGINSYAGAIPPIGSLLGYNFIYGNLGVSICAGLPSSGVQFPGTIFLSGLGIPGIAGGIRLQSPTGIQMLSDTYIQNLYPLDGNGLTIQGRSLPTGYVTIKDVTQLTMNLATPIQTDRITSVANLGILFQDAIQATTIEPPTATGSGTPNLVIKGNTGFIPGSFNNFVQIQNADTIAFDVSGAGALSNVKSINGAAWPPPTGDASLWSQYPQTSVLDSSGFGIINLSTINGQPVDDLTPQGWATFPAIQNVDISGFDLNNVNSMTMPANGLIVAAGQLSIFSDLSGDLSLAANGGGNVNIGTGNAGDINITTGGTGNEVTIGGDVVYLNATQGVQVSAPVLDMATNNIYNVNTLRGSLNTDLRVVADGTGNLNQEGTIINLTAPTKVLLDTPILDANGADIANVANVTNEGSNLLTVQSTVNLIVSAETALTLVSDTADVTVQGQTGVSIYAATGDVRLTADSGEVVIQDSLLNMNNHKIVNLVAGSAGTDAVNYTQLTFRDNTEFYVSNQGSDVSGNGSILAPFLTIQAAITAAELISSAASICNINVASGNYPQSLIFNKGYVVLNGTLQSQTGNEVCEITGSITINCTGANDVFNRQVAFQGFNITCGAGQSITNTSTSSHTTSFQDCKIFVNSVCYNSTATCADARTYFTNVEVSQTNAASTSPVITTNVGLVELERMDLSVNGNAIGILIGGTSVLNRCSLSTLEATNTAATLLPLLSFTSTTTSTHSLGNVAFAFTSAVAKTATNAVYINSGVATAIIMLNNVFTLAGTASSTNNCVGYNGVGSPTIAGVNNTSLNVNVLLPQTTSVQTGITQIQYTNIQPPGLATYSSTADQPIAVTGTPQALTYNTTQFNQGTTLVANSRVYANAQGNYNLNYSVELQHTGGGVNQTATTFLKKNGTTIANTGRQWSIASGGFQIAAMAEFTVSLNAGDYVEVFFSGDTSLSANATAAAGALPAVPSVVFNIKQFR
jgi:hypothetical protein